MAVYLQTQKQVIGLELKVDPNGNAMSGNNDIVVSTLQLLKLCSCKCLQWQNIK